MKLTSLVFPLLSLSSIVFAAGEDGQKADQDLVIDENFVPTPEKPFNFHINYEIKFKENKETGLIDDFYNGETVELAYTFKSLEPAEVSIVGVGGELTDPITGVNLANITASQIGPISVVNNQTVTFNQRIGVNVAPGKHVLVPAVYIMYKEQFMVLGSNNKIVNIVEPSISFFNPQLLISELILAVTVALVGYMLYNTFASTYLSGILPDSMLPNDKKKSSKTKAKKEPLSASASTSDFESWLPDSHKNLSKKTKKKA